VAAFVELVVMDEFGIRPLGPALWSGIELVREYAHGRRDNGVFDGEERSPPVLPIKTSP
jgi:hypothetical protein